MPRKKSTPPTDIQPQKAIAEKPKKHAADIEPVTDYTPPASVGQLLQSDADIIKQYKSLQEEVSAELDAWRQSHEALKLAGSQYTIKSAMGGIALLRKIADRKNYQFIRLIHKPEKLLAALDEYCELCLQLGILPSKESLCMFLHTSISSYALVSNGNNSQFLQEIIDILNNFDNYIISTWVQYANLSNKPPIFSIFYLKSVYFYDDNLSKNSKINLNIYSGNNLQVNKDPEKLATDCNIIDIETDSDDKKGS